MHFNLTTLLQFCTSVLIYGTSKFCIFSGEYIRPSSPRLPGRWHSQKAQINIVNSCSMSPSESGLPWNGSADELTNLITSIFIFWYSWEIAAKINVTHVTLGSATKPARISIGMHTRSPGFHSSVRHAQAIFSHASWFSSHCFFYLAHLIHSKNIKYKLFLRSEQL